MLRDGEPIGAINVTRREPTAFNDTQIALLKHLRNDQAVIAIENVRLFNETKEALERQTATGEILASISGSMTDAKARVRRHRAQSAAAVRDPLRRGPLGLRDGDGGDASRRWRAGIWKRLIERYPPAG